jgi:isoquinoline 1-oxidoreductase alpha subunit
MANVTSLNVNGKKLRVDVDSQTPLLNVLRDHLNLTGTKYGCGEARCGACTVLVDGQMMRSCVTPVGRVGSKQVTTIEGSGERRQTASAAGGFPEILAART